MQVYIGSLLQCGKLGHVRFKFAWLCIAMYADDGKIWRGRGRDAKYDRLPKGGGR